MALLKCTNINGGQTMLETDPAILTFNDVIYVPFADPASQPGLYDHGQKMILQSWYFRTVNPLARHGGLGTPYEYRMLPEAAPDDLYIYAGWLHFHFGHFLLSSLSRFWSRQWEQHPDARILVHSNEALDWWFTRDWFSALAAAMGLSRDRFVVFDKPTRVRRVIVSAPAFEEENFAHRAFARFGNALGRRLAGDRIGMPDNRPVFLSKEKLTSGVQRLENENEITAVLERNGVEIVFPERLGLAEQAALWYNRPFVASFTNSSLHTSIFAPGRHIVGLCYGDAVMSNYTLLDEANRTQSLYLSPAEGSFVHNGAGNGFHTNHVARDPVGVAEDLLRVLDFQQRAGASRAGESIVRRRGYWSHEGESRLPADPKARLLNLAVGKPTRQSSTAPWEPLRQPNANSGILTGSYQFHTDIEQDPWWEIDLLAPSSIVRVRLFNRVDNSGERCGRFTLSVRLDEREPYVVAHLQDVPVSFGGLSGTPFEWTAPSPLPARFLRITLLDRQYLHLDQVEIIGETSGPARARSALGIAAVPTGRADGRRSWLSALLGRERA